MPIGLALRRAIDGNTTENLLHEGIRSSLVAVSAPAHWRYKPEFDDVAAVLASA